MAEPGGPPGEAPSPSPMDRFESFTLTHLVTVLLAIAGWVAMVRWLRRVRDTPRELATRRALVLAIAVACVAGTAYWMWDYGADPSFALPLHLCDLAWVVGCWSLLSRAALPADLIHYWGFGLSAQAFVTPTLQEGPADYHFWLFWFVHWAIVGIAIANVAAFRYRASWRGMGRAMLASLALFCVVTPLNLLFESNYWFTGRAQPDRPTILDGLGPYPLRLVWMALLVAALFVLMTWPWEWARRRRTPRMARGTA